MSEFEEREAATFTGTPWHLYVALDRLERAGAVAHFRVHKLVESHQSDAVGAEVKKRAAETPRARGRGRAPRGTFDDTFRGGRQQI